MSTFTIDSENNITALVGLPTGAEESFSTPKELAKLTAEWPATRLVETWNSFAGVAPFDELKAVKKFTSRKSAVARIWTAVQRLSPDGAPQSRPPRPSRRRPRRKPQDAHGRARAQPKRARTRRPRSSR